MKTTGMLWMCALLLWVASGGAGAVSPGEARRSAEASMLVNGTVVVDAQGEVTSFELNDRAQIPPELVSLVERTVPRWTFEPVIDGGKPVAVRSNVTMRLVARQRDGQYVVHVAAANFSAAPKPGNTASGALITGMVPPRYPRAAFMSGMGGIVYVVVDIDAQGKVVNAFAEQVNLDIVGPEQVMRAGREVLAKPTLEAARKWSFDPAAIAVDASGRRTARVPVSFQLSDSRKPPAKYSWQGYIPGPRQQAPWLEGNPGVANGNDALVPGEAFVAGSGPKLVSPLDAG